MKIKQLLSKLKSKDIETIKIYDNSMLLTRLHVDLITDYILTKDYSHHQYQEETKTLIIHL